LSQATTLLFLYLVVCFWDRISLTFTRAAHKLVILLLVPLK
jgi:hypothetical protein